MRGKHLDDYSQSSSPSLSCAHTNKIGDLTIRIDRTLCIATSNRMGVAPEVFEYDDENICAFKADVGTIERGPLIEACQGCPVDALIVTDAKEQQLVP